MHRKVTCRLVATVLKDMEQLARERAVKERRKVTLSELLTEASRRYLATERETATS